MDPYLEEFLKMNGIECQGKELLPKYGELNTDILRHCLLGEEIETLSSEKSAVVRPPVLCAGCPHRGFFYTLSKKKGIMITGDIGCYTLGSAPPLSALDTTFCMGGSISTGYGAAQAFKKAEMPTKVVAVIGDSTFFHTGIPSLIGASYNGASSTTVILDNRITGMTGHQENPGTGFTLMGDPAIEVDIPALCEAIGIKKENIWIVDPNDLKEVSGVLDEAIAKDEPTVVITRWPCMLKKFSQQDKDEFTTLNTRQCYIDQEACRNCKSCVRTGCPALISTKEKVVIDKNSCTGCTVCKQVCPFNAISEVAR